MFAAESRSVLVVDDYRDTADSTAALLEMAGHRVAVAYSAEAGACRVRAERFDVILLEDALRGVREGDVARRVGWRNGDRRPLLVAVSVVGTSDVRERCRAAGVDKFFLKPADPAELLQLVADAPVVGPG